MIMTFTFADIQAAAVLCKHMLQFLTHRTNGWVDDIPNSSFCCRVLVPPRPLSLQVVSYHRCLYLYLTRTPDCVVLPVAGVSSPPVLLQFNA